MVCQGVYAITYPFRSVDSLFRPLSMAMPTLQLVSRRCLTPLPKLSPVFSQHDDITNDKLVHKRIQAFAQAVTAGRVSDANHAPDKADRLKAQMRAQASRPTPPPAVPTVLVYAQLQLQSPPMQPLNPRHYPNAPRYTLSDSPTPPPHGGATSVPPPE